jgi:hypothetical protein
MLDWKKITDNHQEALLGTRDDGVVFLLTYNELFQFTGPYKLMIIANESMKKLWGINGILKDRYFFKEENAKSEAIESAKLMFMQRQKVQT